MIDWVGAYSQTRIDTRDNRKKACTRILLNMWILLRREGTVSSSWEFPWWGSVTIEKESSDISF